VFTKRVCIMSGGAVIEIVDPQRARQILRAPNAIPIASTPRKLIAAIELVDHGADWRIRSRWNNPQKLVLRSETDENPANVWTLKRLQLMDTGMKCDQASEPGGGWEKTPGRICGGTARLSR
jgi:hypothetical protein